MIIAEAERECGGALVITLAIPPEDLERGTPDGIGQICRALVRGYVRSYGSGDQATSDAIS